MPATHHVLTSNNFAVKPAPGWRRIPAGMRKAEGDLGPTRFFCWGVRNAQILFEASASGSANARHGWTLSALATGIWWRRPLHAKRQKNRWRQEMTAIGARASRCFRSAFHLGGRALNTAPTPQKKEYLPQISAGLFAGAGYSEPTPVRPRCPFSPLAETIATITLSTARSLEPPTDGQLGRLDFFAWCAPPDR